LGFGFWVLGLLGFGIWVFGLWVLGLLGFGFWVLNLLALSPFVAAERDGGGRMPGGSSTATAHGPLRSRQCGRGRAPCPAAASTASVCGYQT